MAPSDACYFNRSSAERALTLNMEGKPGWMIQSMLAHPLPLLYKFTTGPGGGWRNEVSAKHLEMLEAHAPRLTTLGIAGFRDLDESALGAIDRMRFLARIIVTGGDPEARDKKLTVSIIRDHLKGRRVVVEYTNPKAS